ncbi:hypothetical protein NGG16_16240 [Enterococcus casseliflavus]|uniref:hypothetical protein n=1 Tax=Enterococcus casseliflavus TaxID=37734 RepID=UPI002DB55DE4|nr:hypothetical protein [Enterococcus casseliflavus]MEB8418985.1 hypothetical protein [Enterococcus casseliflavus]
MSVSIKGTEQILKNIEAKLGESRTNRVVNKVLRECGERNKRVVKQSVSAYMDTGKTHNLVVSSNVKSNPKRVETGWASKERAPLVHLNEFGYTRFGKYVRPQGMGKLQEAVDYIEGHTLPIMQKKLKVLSK